MSYHIISIMSYHIISYHIISYHIISYHIISYHIISYHIISYQITSFHSILFHFISFHFILIHFISNHHVLYHKSMFKVGAAVVRSYLFKPKTYKTKRKTRNYIQYIIYYNNILSTDNAGTIFQDECLIAKETPLNDSDSSPTPVVLIFSFHRIPIQALN